MKVKVKVRDFIVNSPFILNLSVNLASCEEVSIAENLGAMSNYLLDKK